MSKLITEEQIKQLEENLHKGRQIVPITYRSGYLGRFSADSEIQACFLGACAIGENGNYEDFIGYSSKDFIIPNNTLILMALETIVPNIDQSEEDAIYVGFEWETLECPICHEQDFESLVMFIGHLNDEEGMTDDEILNELRKLV
jgi:hypothetical protein